LGVEFSRVSQDGRLTLVIDLADGVPVGTRYVLSPRTLISDAIEDLAKREGTLKKKIGFVDLKALNTSAGHAADQAAPCQTISASCEQRQLHGAVWTALSPNFQKETGKAFSVDNAVAYLKSLPKGARSVALHYIESAPEEVITPVRTAVMADIDRLR